MNNVKVSEIESKALLRSVRATHAIIHSEHDVCCGKELVFISSIGYLEGYEKALSDISGEKMSKNLRHIILDSLETLFASERI